MSETMKQTVQVSDWVSGTSVHDEKFIGYVEAIDLNGMVKVMVTQCDHAEAVGLLVGSSLTKLEKLGEYEPNEETPLRSLMDLALMTRDLAWFNDLVAELHIAQLASRKGLSQRKKLFGTGAEKVKNRLSQ
jgi:hypothetical protein